MKTVTVADAAADFRRLLDEVAGGETFVITQDEAPVAQLVPPASVETDDGNRRDVVAEWRAYRRAHNITLGDELTIREMIDEGRRPR